MCRGLGISDPNVQIRVFFKAVIFNNLQTMSHPIVWLNVEETSMTTFS